jgi:hypothetical protein
MWLSKIDVPMGSWLWHLSCNPRVQGYYMTCLAGNCTCETRIGSAGRNNFRDDIAGLNQHWELVCVFWKHLGGRQQEWPSSICAEIVFLWPDDRNHFHDLRFTLSTTLRLASIPSTNIRIWLDAAVLRGFSSQERHWFSNDVSVKRSRYNNFISFPYQVLNSDYHSSGWANLSPKWCVGLGPRLSSFTVLASSVAFNVLILPVIYWSYRHQVINSHS